MKTWKGKLLSKYTKGELIDICAELIDMYGMVASTQPEDLKADLAERDRFKPSKEETWKVPQNVGMIVKGKM